MKDAIVRTRRSGDRFAGKSVRLLAACVTLAGCASSGEKTPRGEGPAAADPAPLCAAPDGSLGTAPLRRLTGFEYGRTLTDLTGAAPNLTSELVPDEESFGFDDQADTYSVSTLH